MRRAVITLIAGLLLMAGAAVLAFAWNHERAAPAPGPSVQIDDGMLYDHTEPWVDPSPPFPLTCAHPAYCELAVDRVCTIIYVMLSVGTSEDDIRRALTPQHDEIHVEDFTDCQGFEQYWAATDSA